MDKQKEIERLEKKHKSYKDIVSHDKRKKELREVLLNQIEWLYDNAPRYRAIKEYADKKALQNAYACGKLTPRQYENLSTLIDEREEISELYDYIAEELRDSIRELDCYISKYLQTVGNIEEDMLVLKGGRHE